MWNPTDYTLPNEPVEGHSRQSAVACGPSDGLDIAHQNQQYDSLPADLSTFWPTFATLPPQNQSSSSSPRLSGATASASSSRATSPFKDASQRLEKQALSSLQILNNSPLIVRPPQSHIRMTDPAQPKQQTGYKPRTLPLASSQYTSPTETCTSADTETSIEENAARGVAYISLEAAAETHYVGQSSGATWASLILK